MFAELYNRKSTIEIHCSRPYLEERLQFLSYLKNRGYSKETLIIRAGWLCTLSEVLNLSRGSISEPEVADQILRWINANKRGIRNHKFRQTSLIRTANKWLTFLGKIPPKELELAKASLTALLLYMEFMKNEKESAATSIINCRRCTIRFLVWIENQKLSLKNLTHHDIDKYVKFKGTRLSRNSMSTSMSWLKSFLLFCHARGLCRHKLSHLIQQPPVFRYENLPSGPPWFSVQKLLEQPDLENTYGIRDRAILLLLAVYGFRSSEVTVLKLEDIDWLKKTISVVRAKGGRRQVFPLTREVGEAIILYLKKVRPKTEYREIFLNIKAPLRPLKPGNLATVTKKYYRVAKITPPHWGPHSLRHACASNLINKDLSLKEVADHLGHFSLHSTRIYAKVNLTGLRQVGDFDLGVLA
jgi:integrase/recombinase XerD